LNLFRFLISLRPVSSYYWKKYSILLCRLIKPRLKRIANIVLIGRFAENSIFLPFVVYVKLAPGNSLLAAGRSLQEKQAASSLDLNTIISEFKLNVSQLPVANRKQPIFNF